MKSILVIALFIVMGYHTHAQSNYSVIFIKGDVKISEAKGAVKPLSITSQIKQFEHIDLQAGAYLFLQDNAGKFYNLIGPIKVTTSDISKYEFKIRESSVSKYLLSLLIGDDKTNEKGNFGGVKAYTTRGPDHILTDIYHYNSYKANNIQFRWNKLQGNTPYKFEIVTFDNSELSTLISKSVTDTFMSMPKAEIPQDQIFWTVRNTNVDEYAQITLVQPEDSSNIANLIDNTISVKNLSKGQQYLILANYFENKNLIYDANIYFLKAIKYSKGKSKISINKIYAIFKNQYILSGN